MTEHISDDTCSTTLRNVPSSSPLISVDKDARLKPEWLKLTILSLSGIHVRATAQKHHRRSKRRAQNFSITASVSFTGSCDPADMRVVSSGLCTQSGLLVVESQPVVVPSGMTDGLMAIWDDSTQGLRHQGSLYSTDTVIFGKQRGTISACPIANPHLFVALRDNVQDQVNGLLSNQEYAAVGDTQDSTVASSLSYGPELDDTDVSSCLTGGTRTGMGPMSPISTRKNREEPNPPETPQPKSLYVTSEEHQQEEMSLRRMSPRRNSIAASTCTASNGNHCAIVNTPFQAAETPTVPEILEMQMSLHINQVPMMNPFKTNTISLRTFIRGWWSRGAFNSISRYTE